MNQRILLVAVLLVSALGIAVAVVLGTKATTTSDEAPPVELVLGDERPVPSLWADVHRPRKVWTMLRSNGWLARALREPLGQGAATGWAGFLSSRGNDMAQAFKGVVFDVVAERLLADPFRVVFFAGPSATGTPAIVVPRPSSSASGAFELFERVARHGRYGAPRCPGEEAPLAPAAGRPPPPALVVSRWLIAEHAVFAAAKDGRIVLSRSPAAVVQALCVTLPEAPPAAETDLTLSFSPEGFGREAQLAASLLGLGPVTRLDFAVEKDRLEPRGLRGDLADPGRLDAAEPPEALLRLIPADAGVVVLATLRLPETLTRDSLRAHLSRTYRGPYRARPVAVIWNPRGDDKLATEVAVAWPEGDAGLLREAFSGPNPMDARQACGYEVYASTPALGLAVQQGCEGKVPSLVHGSPPLANGLRQRLSVAVAANLGALLSRLLGDAFAREAASRGQASPDIEAARRLLEELPSFGLRGVAEGHALVPGGFRS